MIYVKLKKPDELVFHYHAKPECKNIPIDTNALGLIGDVIVGINEEEYESFAIVNGEHFTVIDNNEMKSSINEQEKLKNMLENA